MALGPEGAEARPRFPLPGVERLATKLPERLPLAGVYVLGERAAPGLVARVSITPLTRRRAVVALVRHTVAARLFASELLERQLDHCVAIAAATPVRGLAYPWKAEAFPAVAGALVCDLERGAAEV